MLLWIRFFIIPIFPLGKTNVLECDNCKRTYKLKELPGQIQQKFELEKHRGIPLKHFAGSAILVALFAWIFYANAKDKENEAIYIKSPQVGDVYHTSGSNSGFYSTAKVTAIEADSIFVIFNDYSIFIVHADATLLFSFLFILVLVNI